jgi:O-antigen/teichoic acid export membrane protein
VILSLLLQYSAFLGLGIPNGAGREIPRFLGAKDPTAAADVEDVASLGVVLTGLLAAVVSVALVPVLIGPQAGSTLLLLGAAAFLQQAFLLEQVFIRSRLRFRAASAQLAAQGLGAPIVGILLLLAGWGINGLLVARAVVVLIALAMAGRSLGRIPKPRFDARRLVAIAMIGLPMLAAGILLVLVVTIDRWIVLALLGPEAVGIYGLVGLAATSLILVPTMISQQYYPRLAFARGEGADGAALLRMARGQAILAGGLTAIAASFVALAAIFVVPAFLPAYVGAVGPILIILVGMVVYAVGSAHGNLLNLLDRQRRFLLIQAVVLGFDIALSVTLVRMGLGIAGAAVGSAVSMTLYSALLYLATAGLDAERIAPPPASPHGSAEGPDVPAPA